MGKNHNYSKAIIGLCEEMQVSGEMPRIHSDSYKDAVIAFLVREKKYSKESSGYGYLQFACLVDLFRGNGDIFDMISQYIKYDEEDEKKNIVATKIADSIVKSASLYYREDIENDVESLYRIRCHDR